jgi:hypothetical protein
MKCEEFFKDALILTIRGHKAIIDAGLAILYDVPTKALNITLYGGAQPELIEGDIFRINVPLTPEVTPEVRNRNILEFCRQPKSMTEIMEHTGLKDREHFRREILKPLIDQGYPQLTIPDKPTSRLQKYVAGKNISRNA